MTRWRWKRAPPPGLVDEWWYAALVHRRDVDKKGTPTVLSPFTVSELTAAFAEEKLGGSLCDALVDLDRDIRDTPYVSTDGFKVIRLRLRLPVVEDNIQTKTQLWSARTPVDLCLQEAGVRLLILTSTTLSTKKKKDKS